mmetsp:Transcript_16227/g.28058  ORF Transcript_16227/g.28058 Transcript_16227/m.28058 type:complete len:263 (+) Transcript_16227:52-840(+)
MDVRHGHPRSAARSLAGYRGCPTAASPWTLPSPTSPAVTSFPHTPLQMENRHGVVPWQGPAARVTCTPPQPRSFAWPCSMSPVAVNSGRVLVQTPSSSTGEADSPAPGCVTPTRQVVVARQTTAPVVNIMATRPSGAQAVACVAAPRNQFAGPSLAAKPEEVSTLCPGSPLRCVKAAAACYPGSGPGGQSEAVYEASADTVTSLEAPLTPQRPSPLGSRNQQAQDGLKSALAADMECDDAGSVSKMLRPHLYHNYPTHGIYM